MRGRRKLQGSLQSLDFCGREAGKGRPALWPRAVSWGLWAEAGLLTSSLVCMSVPTGVSPPPAHWGHEGTMGFVWATEEEGEACESPRATGSGGAISLGSPLVVTPSAPPDCPLCPRGFCLSAQQGSPGQVRRPLPSSSSWGPGAERESSSAAPVLPAPLLSMAPLVQMRTQSQGEVRLLMEVTALSFPTPFLSP